MVATDYVFINNRLPGGVFEGLILSKGLPLETCRVALRNMKHGKAGDISEILPGFVVEADMKDFTNHVGYGDIVRIIPEKEVKKLERKEELYFPSEKEIKEVRDKKTKQHASKKMNKHKLREEGTESKPASEDSDCQEDSTEKNVETAESNYGTTKMNHRPMVTITEQLAAFDRVNGDVALSDI